MARTDYGAILSTVIQGTSQSIRDKENTSDLIAPKNWGRAISRMNHSLTDTVKGSVCSFNDGADGTPIQLLKASVSGTGCNVKNDINYGGDVNFNQLVQNGNFASVANWTKYGGGDYTVSDNVASLFGANGAQIFQDCPNVSGHKYLFVGNVKGDGTNGVSISFDNASPANLPSVTSANWTKVEKIIVSTSTNILRTHFKVVTAETSATVYISKVNLINLTQMFGSTKADEIYAMEQATAGSGVAYVRSLLYKDYYAYNTGTVTNISAVNGDTDDYVIYPISWATEVGTITSGTMQINADGTIDITSGGTTTRLASTVDVTTYLGTNNIWVDTGDTELTYYMDMDLHYDNVMAQLVEETTTGSVVSFADGANNIPCKNLEVNVDAWQEGSGNPTPDNKRPIHGWSASKVTRFGGKNMLDVNSPSCSMQSYLLVDGRIATPSTNTWMISGYIPIKAGISFVASRLSNGGSGTYVCLYDKNKQFTRSILIVANQSVVFTPNANEEFVRLSIRRAASEYLTAQLEIGSTATAYEPFVSSDDYTIQLGEEIFGGKVNFTTGEMEVDHKTYLLFEISEYKNWYGRKTVQFSISDIISTNQGVFNVFGEVLRPTNLTTVDFGIFHQNKNIVIILPDDYTVSDYNSNVAGTKLLYPLAEPFTVQLTPQQISTLLGNNTFFADTGDISVTYRANGALYAAQH